MNLASAPMYDSYIGPSDDRVKEVMMDGGVMVSTVSPRTQPGSRMTTKNSSRGNGTETAPFNSTLDLNVKDSSVIGEFNAKAKSQTSMHNYKRRANFK
jgi:hypothetical protein